MRPYICERCGGTGQQSEGCWSGSAYDSPAGVCRLCDGEGLLGYLEGEVKKAKAAKKRSVGRPKVHTEEMVPVLVRIPRSVVTQLDKLGGSRQAAVLAAIVRRLSDDK